MIFLNPFIVIIGMIIYIIPYLWPLSFAITMFIYHILLKNRDEHIKRLKKLFKAKNIELIALEQIKEGNSLKILFGYLISFAGFSIIFIKISNQLEKFYNQISSVEELQNLEYVLPGFDTFLFFLFLFFIWFTYTKLINKIIKDQFYIQNVEIQKNLIDKPILKYRDSNFVMFLRIITFNLYEWFLLISLIKETNSLYIADGTYKILEENNKNEDIINNKKVDTHSMNLDPKNFNSKDEFLSYVYLELSKLDTVSRIKKMEELLQKNILTKEEIEKIKKMF
ncbi:hypothetical protein SAMN02745164_01353 [Marinitoga hydrogenitolerans DSM 16785]|uniref:Uncharacterized protein n=1 Tax=Marinitoga hydrogenitolerans (strain DSM 16785 / JCM 12826 / AT1271) TaxID=1122195 RepID=A0A1M4X7L5_MARH1|nr:hypothetical protein [Marinitoga hydrogenitolerans]SHE89112.1 hypothetical protein SAMN02745164_01353 [Marinitoga hydrogenitolerans DSM 16785]